MAVSMLAGCKGATEPTEPENPVAPTGMVGKVIEALDDDITDKVSFTSDSTLQNALDKMVENAGDDTTGVNVGELLRINPTLGSKTALPGVNTKNLADTEANDKKEHTYVGVITLGNATTEEFAVYQLANQIASKNVYGSGSGRIADLPEKSAVDAKDEYRYTFEYTGTMAVASVDDTVAGTSTYVVAFTITRTPSKVDV